VALANSPLTKATSARNSHQEKYSPTPICKNYA
jgi:hypothetical protein